MKKILLALVVVQIACISFFFAPTNLVQAFHANAYSYDAEVSPQFFNIVPCPSCATPSYAQVSGGASPYAAASTIPNVAVTANQPAPSIDPCNTDASIASDNARRGRHHKRHHGSFSNFMQTFLKFLLEFINKLLQLLGGGQLPLPETAPVPGGVVTTGGVINPNPCDLPQPSASVQIPSPVLTNIPSTNPGASVAPSPVTSGTRDALKQPFASNSIWNMPIGSGAKYVAANLPANPGSDTYTPMPQIDDEHIVLRPTAPVVAINYSDAGWSGKDRCNGSGSGGNLPVSVPIPADYLVPNDNTNSAAAFLLADKRTIVQVQPLARCTAGSSGTSVVKFDNVDLYGDGIIGAHGGSKLSAVGGSIRVGELRPGQQGMHHALKLNVDSPHVLFTCKTESECFRWPASVADSGAVGNYGSKNPSPNPAMKMGALLAIPATVDINSLGLESEPGKQIAWTLQNYGTYIVDSTGGPAYAFSAENGPDGSVRSQFQTDYGMPFEQRINSNTTWSRDVQKLMTKLSVVDNNSQSSIGGGGTPRQPLAPPIAP